MAVGERFGHEAASIENKVCTFKETAPSDADEVGVTGTCTNDFDMTTSAICMIYGQSSSPVLTFNFWKYQLAVVGTEDGSSLTDAGSSYMLLHGGAGSWNFNGCKLFGGEECNFVFVIIWYLTL